VTIPDPELERLRAAHRSTGFDARPRADCPEAARLWDAAAGTLPVEERRDLVDHTAGCPVCAEAWRLLVEIRSLSGMATSVSANAPGRAAVSRWPALAMAAAMLLAVAGGVVLLRGPQGATAPGFREPVVPGVRSLVPPDAPLRREDFWLRWSPGPEGSRYEVFVTDESLATLASARDLAEPSFVVAAPALDSLGPGARVLWRVRVTLPDGQRRDSETFVATLR
jgi:hypothetical protein